MDKKINKFIAFTLFVSIAFSFPIPQANAGILDWALREKADNFQSKITAFAGIGKDSGINLGTEENTSSVFELLQGNSLIATNNPLSAKKNKKSENKTYIVPASAYSSTIDQTDRTPFITASGTHVREGVIAANFLPIGTVVKIPELFGDKAFVVEDRMHSRYFYQIDIWFSTRNEAKNFGIKKIKIEIVS